MKRIVQNNQDPGSIESTIFSPQSGAQKNFDIGPHLIPLDNGAGGKTTNATTARGLPAKGRSLAIYNNSGSVGSITLGSDASVVSQSAGAVNGSTGEVGIPCPPNAWLHVACWDKNWVIASAATLLVFLIADDSTVG